MLITQFDKFVNRSTQQILGSAIERENLAPMLSSDIPPNLQNLKVTENGIYYPDRGYDGFYEVDVDIPTNLQDIVITENGKYYPSEGYDGIYEVDVNIRGDSYPLWTDIYDDLPSGVSVSTPTITAPVLTPGWVASRSQNVKDFIDNYCRLSTLSSATGTTISANITKAMAQNSLSQVTSDPAYFGGLIEYYGNLYGNALLTTFNMALLGDFSQGGSSVSNALSDAITNYSAVALQGIYGKNRTSTYNTTTIYPLDLNVTRWTGMKDRNNSYSCTVIFTDTQTVKLGGNRQVIIYGIP